MEGEDVMNSKKALRNVLIERLLKQLRDYKNWEVGSCTIEYIKSGDQYWIANGHSSFSGYGDTFFKITFFDKFKIWKHVKKMIELNLIFKMRSINLIDKCNEIVNESYRNE